MTYGYYALSHPSAVLYPAATAPTQHVGHAARSAPPDPPRSTAVGRQ